MTIFKTLYFAHTYAIYIYINGHLRYYNKSIYEILKIKYECSIKNVHKTKTGLFYIYYFSFTTNDHFKKHIFYLIIFKYFSLFYKKYIIHFQHCQLFPVT